MRGTTTGIAGLGATLLVVTSASGQAEHFTCGEEVGCMLTDAGVEKSDGFAVAVAISGDVVMIGAPGDGSQAGAVYVHSDGINCPMPADLQPLMAENVDPGDHFGHSVAVFGTLAVIGAPDDEPDPGEDRDGSAYVFEYDARMNEWMQIAVIESPVDSGICDFPNDFGQSVATDGSLIVVGAPAFGASMPDCQANDYTQGAVFVYDVGALREATQLPVGGLVTEARFGESVAMSGAVIVVGAPGEVSGGAAFVFRQEPAGGWLLESRIDPPVTNGTTVGFGSYVAVNGNVLLVGAPPPSSGAGQGTFLYVFDGTSWDLQAALDSEMREVDGRSGAVAGDVVVVSGYLCDTETEPVARVARSFRLEQGAWIQRAVLIPSDTEAATTFADAMSMDVASGDRVAVARPPGGTPFGGAAYLYDGMLDGRPESCCMNPDLCCVWDLDGDDDVGVTDFLLLLAAWGTDPCGLTDPDFDNDGDVGITDFLDLLANWGPCST